MKTAKDRLIEFLAYLKIGQNAFEENCGISNGYISNNKGSLGSKTISKISLRYPELNTVWLITGLDGMLKSTHGVPINFYKELLDKKDAEIRELNREIGALQSKIEAFQMGNSPFAPLPQQKGAREMNTALKTIGTNV